MTEFVPVRDLKNRATQILREVEEGKTLIVTRRGKPVVTLKPFDVADVRSGSSKYPTTMYDALRSRIEARYPALKNRSSEQQRRHFEKITEKIRRASSFESWQEMDKAAKGDRKRSPKE